MIYGMDLLKCDAGLLTLAGMPPGTEVTEDVYMALKTMVRPLPLPDETRIKSPLGITEGFLFGRLHCWRDTDRMFLAFGMSRRRGKNYYFLGLSSMDGRDNSRVDFKRAMRDPNYFIRMRMRGKI